MKELAYGDEIYDELSSFSTANATVWIDPLDGTSDFVKGNLSAVTVLIGVAIDGLPKIGVVHNPFKENDAKSVGVTVFGTQEHGAFTLDFDPSASLDQLKSRVPQYLQPFDQQAELA